MDDNKRTIKHICLVITTLLSGKAGVVFKVKQFGNNGGYEGKFTWYGTNGSPYKSLSVVTDSKVGLYKRCLESLLENLAMTPTKVEKDSVGEYTCDEVFAVLF